MPIPPDYTFPDALPTELRASLAEAEGAEMNAAIDAAFAAVAFPFDRNVELPAERLTPAQRALAQVLVECGLWNLTCRGRVPHRDDLSRWLGLDPPDPFQEEVDLDLDGGRSTEPLWRAMRLVASADRRQPGLLRAFVQTIPVPKRLECWALCALRFPAPWSQEGSSFFAVETYPEQADDLSGHDASAWAAHFLDQFIEAKNTAHVHTLLPFLALLRAGARIEPRWFRVLPRAGDYDMVDAILFSIPEHERRDAMQGWLGAMLFPNEVLKAVTRVLPRVPDPALLARALDVIPKAMGSARLHRRRLREAAAEHPELLAQLDAADAAAGPPKVLTLLGVRAPAETDDLSEVDRAQLLEAGKRYHGKKLPLETLMAEDPQSEESLRRGLQILAIGDAKGKHIYDGWLYMADSGCFFAAGKTRVVAERVQFAIECKDDKLADALETLLAGPLEVRAKSERPPSKHKPAASTKATKPKR